MNKKFLSGIIIASFLSAFPGSFIPGVTAYAAPQITEVTVEADLSSARSGFYLFFKYPDGTPLNGLGVLAEDPNGTNIHGNVEPGDKLFFPTNIPGNYTIKLTGVPQGYKNDSFVVENVIVGGFPLGYEVTLERGEQVSTSPSPAMTSPQPYTQTPSPDTYPGQQGYSNNNIATFPTITANPNGITPGVIINQNNNNQNDTQPATAGNPYVVTSAVPYTVPATTTATTSAGESFRNIPIVNGNGVTSATSKTEPQRVTTAPRTGVRITTASEPRNSSSSGDAVTPASSNKKNVFMVIAGILLVSILASGAYALLSTRKKPATPEEKLKDNNTGNSNPEVEGKNAEKKNEKM